MEVKEYIVEEADKLFCQYGFKSVTMDDIAKHLGMSKKTIYQHFRDAKITAKFVAINGILWDYQSHIMRLKLS